ncbi:PREDICTED: olfactory receptor 14J1-like [Tinamus guttatus]|uniref:olfactory receptor 14J1-like n=1 Tax=Tinamus guttatus TaxID=94827 RepID=UPI00052EC77C|nr:PREDICTED: olfactory receptor 14J1-like [Tinamus guttatus]
MILLGITDTQELQLLHFSLFLAFYLAALLANGLIITAVAHDHHLHTPMYFFLLSLSVLDIVSISVTVPRSMANSLSNTRATSYSRCAAQVFLFVFLLVVEYFLLIVMAYDHFVAIYRPLHYRTLLGNVVEQFFCETPQILKLSCSDVYLREDGVLVVSLSLVSLCIVFIVVSYVQIFSAVLRISSEQG